MGLGAGVLAPDEVDTTPAGATGAIDAEEAADVDVALVEERVLSRRDSRIRRLVAAGEAGGLLVAPIVAYLVLQLRLMSRPGAPDPAIHSGFIFDPSGLFARYSQTLSADAGLREAARVGFIVPARICYLLFGAVPGYAVFRYVLALVAIVPVYLLFRRLSGPGAGAFAASLVLVSPVFVTSWGTDYPNGACLSYLAAGTACLFMPASRRSRLIWAALAGGAFTMAVWSLVIAFPLAVTAFIVYSVPRVRTQPKDLAKKLYIALAAAVVVSEALALGSQAVLGRWDYIATTISSSQFFAAPVQLARRHSASWQWLPYLNYLLVLPATVAAWANSRGRRIKRLREPQTALGVVLLLQVAIFAYLQFGFGLWTLEDHYFSSLLWPAVCLTLAAVAVDLGHRVFDRRRYSWIPAVAVVALEWGYERWRPGWRMEWAWVGATVAVAAVAIVIMARISEHLLRRHGRVRTPIAMVTLLAVFAAPFVLTVANPARHSVLRDVVTYPPASYGAALGESDSEIINVYRVSSMVPDFVGPPQYRGEQLLTWWPHEDTGKLYPLMGLYHADRNSLGQFAYPNLAPATVRRLEEAKPGEIVIIDTQWPRIRTAVRSLAPYGAKVLRHRALRAGKVKYDVTVVELQKFVDSRAT